MSTYPISSCSDIFPTFKISLRQGCFPFKISMTSPPWARRILNQLHVFIQWAIGTDQYKHDLFCKLADKTQEMIKILQEKHKNLSHAEGCQIFLYLYHYYFYYPESYLETFFPNPIRVMNTYLNDLNKKPRQETQEKFPRYLKDLSSHHPLFLDSLDCLGEYVDFLKEELGSRIPYTYSYRKYFNLLSTYINYNNAFISSEGKISPTEMKKAIEECLKKKEELPHICKDEEEFKNLMNILSNENLKNLEDSLEEKKEDLEEKKEDFKKNLCTSGEKEWKALEGESKKLNEEIQFLTEELAWKRAVFNGVIKVLYTLSVDLNIKDNKLLKNILLRPMGCYDIHV